jgi:NAD(P)-dependent dehydrogenase (short-subunit alcohol dehydrogenase family)
MSDRVAIVTGAASWRAAVERFSDQAVDVVSVDRSDQVAGVATNTGQFTPRPLPQETQ